MRKLNYMEHDGRQIDTASREWLVICLARWICRRPTKRERHEFLGKLRWSAPAIDELKHIIRIEWDRMYPKQSTQGMAANDNA